METFVSSLLTIFAGVAALPVAVLFLEVAAATILPQSALPPPPACGPRPRLAVLVPAHNESTGLLPTLANIKGQLCLNDRLLVIADNCSDDTAAVAAAAGAEVVVRTDPAKIGKGYALDWGVRHLHMDQPDIVVVIDADCQFEESAIDRLASACAATGRPVQALYLMIAPNESQISYQVAEFAWRVKNWVRPLGLSALKLPCQLVGSGMAFPWDVIRAVDLANGWIVEDVKLGLDLALSGNAPLFCPSARVISHFPPSAEAAGTQRRRWEHGHLNLILNVGPRLLYIAVKTLDLGLLALALDIAVPPLSLLGISIILSVGFTALTAMIGFSSTPLIITASSAGAFAASAIFCWWRYGRDVLPASRVMLVALYVGRKIPLYCQILFRRTAPEWIRTDRGKS